MQHSLRLALLLNLAVTSLASAQPTTESAGFGSLTGGPTMSVVEAAAQHGAEDFSGLARGRNVIVATDSGVETSGRLVRITDEELTLTVNGRDQTFTRPQVASIFERGDSIKNGMKWGFLLGAAVGLADGATRDLCGPDYVGIGIYCSGDRARHVAGEGAGLAALGAVIGAGVDALIRGRRLLYEKPKRADAPAILLVPSLAPSRRSLQMSVSW